MDIPLVSVIIPTYNRFSYLLNTINSVKNQTYKNIEIIVVNDNSIQKEYYEYEGKKNNIIIKHCKIHFFLNLYKHYIIIFIYEKYSFYNIWFWWS